METAPPLALVTGASSGIGRELARHFATHGHDLVINAEDDAGLAAVAAELRVRGTRVDAVCGDLRERGVIPRLYAAATAGGRVLDAAALNAGVGKGGAFLDTDIEDELEVIDLNVRSTVMLAKRVLRGMARRRAGRLLVTSSIASQLPGSYEAVYSASKAFLQSWAEAVRGELQGSGVTVTVLVPGPTDTDFFRRAGMVDTRIGRLAKDDPALVAHQGVDGMVKGRQRVLAGSLGTKAQGIAAMTLPGSLTAPAHRRMARPRAPDEF